MVPTVKSRIGSSFARMHVVSLCHHMPLHTKSDQNLLYLETDVISGSRFPVLKSEFPR